MKFPYSFIVMFLLAVCCNVEAQELKQPMPSGMPPVESNTPPHNVPVVPAEETTAPAFSQYPLEPASASYRLNSMTPGDFDLVFDISQYSAGNWGLEVKNSLAVSNQKASGNYRITLDSTGGVLHERADTDEVTYAGSARLVERDRVHKTSEFEVEIKENPILGKSKVIRATNHNKGREKEFMVGANDIVASYMSIFAWIGTIENFPQEGMLIRWVFDGKPWPIWVQRMHKNGNLVYTMYPAPNRESQMKPGTYFAKFLYPESRLEHRGFMFPERVELNLRMNVVLKKVNGGQF